MAFPEEPAWRGKVHSGGWQTAAGGDARVTEPVTMRGDITPYPF